jgi:hypothetical protein
VKGVCHLKGCNDRVDLLVDSMDPHLLFITVEDDKNFLLAVSPSTNLHATAGISSSHNKI